MGHDLETIMEWVKDGGTLSSSAVGILVSEIKRLKRVIDNKVEIAILEADRDHAEIERLVKAVKDINAFAQSAPEDEMHALNNAIDKIIKITEPILRELQQALKEK